MVGGLFLYGCAHHSCWPGRAAYRVFRSAAPLPLPAAASCLAPPRATQQTTQKPASAPPRTCRTAPNVLLHVEDLPRASLSAGRRRATLIRQAAPSPRAKATIGAMRGAWRVAVVWVLSCMGSEGGATADLHCACLGGE